LGLFLCCSDASGQSRDWLARRLEGSSVLANAQKQDTMSSDPSLETYDLNLLIARLLMSKEQTTDLLKFLKSFGDDIKETALWLREFVWDLYPEANELIYDNYNALAFGWSPTDRVGHTFCSVAVWRSGHNVHFGFYSGSELSDPKKLLLGEGKQYRYILVKNKKDFPNAYMTKLVREAYANSVAKVKDKKQFRQGATIVKSISTKKRKAARKLRKKKP
jgi:hypothetical protein